jgi:hypothetical protein
MTFNSPFGAATQGPTTQSSTKTFSITVEGSVSPFVSPTLLLSLPLMPALSIPTPASIAAGIQDVFLASFVAAFGDLVDNTGWTDFDRNNVFVAIQQSVPSVQRFAQEFPKPYPVFQE